MNSVCVFGPRSIRTDKIFNGKLSNEKIKIVKFCAQKLEIIIFLVSLDDTMDQINLTCKHSTRLVLVNFVLSCLA